MPKDTQQNDLSGHLMVGMPVKRARVRRFHDITEDPATLEEIGCRIAEGESLKDICKAWMVPAGEMLMWLMKESARYEVYKRALEVNAHAIVAEVMPLVDAPVAYNDKGSVDTGDIAYRKLRVDARMRIAKYHAPERYADKMAGMTVNVGANSLVSILSGMGSDSKEVYEVHETDSHAPPVISRALAPVMQPEQPDGEQPDDGMPL